MKSVSKSVTSLALGIAIDRWLIGSTNEPIFSIFPELSDLLSAKGLHPAVTRAHHVDGAEAGGGDPEHRELQQ
jgi:hypothetical protein